MNLYVLQEAYLRVEDMFHTLHVARNCFISFENAGTYLPQMIGTRTGKIIDSSTFKVDRHSSIIEVPLFYYSISLFDGFIKTKKCQYRTRLE